jgi:hypothetical protein
MRPHWRKNLAISQRPLGCKTTLARVCKSSLGVSSTVIRTHMSAVPPRHASRKLSVLHAQSSGGTCHAVCSPQQTQASRKVPTPLLLPGNVGGQIRLGSLRSPSFNRIKHLNSPSSNRIRHYNTNSTLISLSPHTGHLPGHTSRRPIASKVCLHYLYYIYKELALRTGLVEIRPQGHGVALRTVPLMHNCLLSCFTTCCQ